jgi:hypothetical protein
MALPRSTEPVETAAFKDEFSVELLTVVDGVINELGAVPAAVAAAWAERASSMCRWTALDNQRSVTRPKLINVPHSTAQIERPIFASGVAKRSRMVVALCGASNGAVDYNSSPVIGRGSGRH